jgi:ectoine hydroxylase-related dioxygenase (phytanoyl-CoA dioxygenase family)
MPYGDDDTEPAEMSVGSVVLYVGGCVHGGGANRSDTVRTGINVEGPAPRPLERYKIALAEDGQILIDKNTKFQEEKGQGALDGAYLPYA